MTTPSPPFGDDDTRDRRVPSWLAVEPLDEVTRARLVGTALAASEDPAPAHHHRRRLTAAVTAAAVLLALVVASVAVLTSRGTDSTTTAVDAPASRAAPESSRGAGDSAVAPAPSGAVTPAEDVLVLPDLGDLGDVSTPHRLETAVAARLTTPTGTATTTVTGCASGAGRAFGTPVAAGTGRIGGQRAVVVVSTQASGSTAAVAIRGRSCAVGVSAILP